MSSVSINLSYRTLKIGWCICKDDFQALRDTARLNSIFWGGTLNPFIVIDDEGLAANIIDTFQPDVLFAASDKPQVHAFIKKYHQASMTHEEVLRDKDPSVLDIRHPIRWVHDSGGFEGIENRITISQWEDHDPLSDLLLLMLGQYPKTGVTNLDYEKQLVGEGFAEIFPSLNPANDLPAGLLEAVVPYRLTKAFLTNASSVGASHHIFVGDATSFFDLVTFWNLRALNRSIIFFDPAYAVRMRDWANVQIDHVKKMQGSKSRYSLGLYSNSQQLLENNKNQFTGVPLSISVLGPHFWTRLNLSSPVVQIESCSVLGNLYERNDKPTLSFELRNKPFSDEPEFYSQRLIVSMRPFYYPEKSGDFTFETIFCPEMNEFYSRETLGALTDDVRSEFDGLGFVINATRNHLDIKAIRKKEMVEKLFLIFGLKLEQSRAGSIARQIFYQLGGPQGARVFKIKGVRDLIRKYRPDHWFNTQAAKEIIDDRDPETNKPRFEKFENLSVEYIEERRKRTSKDALRFLLKKEVFRPGIAVQCRKCQMEFWTPVNDMSSKLACLYCGNEQSIAVDVPDLQWQYRKSGLFGHDNNQEGAIPVLVSIQQLDTCLSSKSSIFLFSSNISGLDLTCETDFIAVTKGMWNIPQILLAECKGKNPIEEADLRNLTRAAERFPEGRFETFILLSKFGDFSPDEIAMIKKYQGEYRSRIIMWTSAELEPYEVYEASKDKFAFQRYDKSLSGLAKATESIFLTPALIPSTPSKV